MSLSSLGQVPSPYSLWDLSFSVFLESVMKTIQAGLSIAPSMVHWEGWTFPISLWQSRFLLQFISLFSYVGVKKFNVWSPTAVGQSFCWFLILGTNMQDTASKDEWPPLGKIQEDFLKIILLWDITDIFFCHAFSIFWGMYLSLWIYVYEKSMYMKDT